MIKQFSDKDLPKLVKQIRNILGEDIIISLKLTKRGAKLHSYFEVNPDFDDDGRDDFTDFEFSKIKNRKIKRNLIRELKREISNKKSEVGYFG